MMTNYEFLMNYIIGTVCYEEGRCEYKDGFSITVSDGEGYRSIDIQFDEYGNVIE